MNVPSIEEELERKVEQEFNRLIILGKTNTISKQDLYLAMQIIWNIAAGLISQQLMDKVALLFNRLEANLDEEEKQRLDGEWGLHK